MQQSFIEISTQKLFRRYEISVQKIHGSTTVCQGKVVLLNVIFGESLVMFVRNEAKFCVIWQI